MYPYWLEPSIPPRAEIGDCFALVADAILTQDQPYPGDETFDSISLRPELRFSMTYNLATRNYRIRDRLVDSQVAVP